MAHKNIEFKASCTNIAAAEEKLLQLNPVFSGIDYQKDTYYNVPHGRLKLREGNIENALIYYERAEVAGAKTSHVILYEHAPSESLKEILLKTHGIRVIVEKTRKIYFLDNVKFHFDSLPALGDFIEVEAIDKNGEMDDKILQEQCERYSKLFSVKHEDFIAASYSDMLLAK